MKKGAVVFDLDDTLFPEKEFVRSGFEAVGNKILHKYGAPGFFEICWNLFLAGQRGKIFNLAIQKLGLVCSPDMVKQCVAWYRTHEPRIQLFKDVEPVFQEMIPQWTLGLISDGFLSVQERKIQALGLCQKIPHRVLSDAYGRAAWKPSLVPYRELMRQIPAPISRFVYVGDNPLKDFQGARSLGWLTVRMRRPATEHCRKEVDAKLAADFEVSSMRELMQKIQ